MCPLAIVMKTDVSHRALDTVVAHTESLSQVAGYCTSRCFAHMAINTILRQYDNCNPRVLGQRMPVFFLKVCGGLLLSFAYRGLVAILGRNVKHA